MQHLWLEAHESILIPVRQRKYSVHCFPVILPIWYVNFRITEGRKESSCYTCCGEMHAISNCRNDGTGCYNVNGGDMVLYVSRNEKVLSAYSSHNITHHQHHQLTHLLNLFMKLLFNRPFRRIRLQHGSRKCNRMFRRSL